jgi:hypothetical protein
MSVAFVVFALLFGMAVAALDGNVPLRGVKPEARMP